MKNLHQTREMVQPRPRFRKLSASLTLGVLILAGVAAGRADDVDSYVKSAMQQQHIPGMAVAVVRNGAVIKAEGYGLADLEHEVPVRPNTVFKIASVSKQFIATGIMLLVQDGKIALNDPVRKYFPDAPETWQPITLRHLLTHTSGIVREGPGFDPRKIQPDIDVIRTAYALPLRFKPGEKWEYCNVGYFALADIIRQISGQSFGDFLKERVFAPVEMRATRVTTASDIVPNRARGYSWARDRFQIVEDWPALRPSGAFLSTILDLAKWEAALLTPRILTEESKAGMWTPVALSDGKAHPYGFGWQLDDWPADSKVPTGVPMIRHGGSLPGFRAGYARWPKQGLAVVVLTNLSSAPIDSLIANIAVRVIPELKTAATPATTAPK